MKLSVWVLGFICVVCFAVGAEIGGYKQLKNSSTEHSPKQAIGEKDDRDNATIYQLNSSLQAGKTASVFGTDTVEAIELVAQNGVTTRLSEFKEKLLLVNFMFTDCSAICPLQTATLVQVQQEIGEDIPLQLLSITLTPETDTIEKLQQFSRNFQVNHSNWLFARTTNEQTQILTKRLGVRVVPDAALPFEHTDSVYLFDKEGLLRQQYAGAGITASKLVSELRALDSAS